MTDPREIVARAIERAHYKHGRFQFDHMSDAVLQALRDAGLAQEWQPISTAPKDGTVIDLWAYCEMHNNWERRAGCRWERMTDFVGHEYDGWYGLNTGKWWSCNVVSPSHWMPLPKPPAAEREGEDT